MENLITEQTLVTGAGCRLVVTSTLGDIRVSGWDQDRVAVHAPAGGALVHQDGNTVNIQAGLDGSGDVRVQAPRQCDLTLRSVSGDIRLEDLAGEFAIQTMSGDVAGQNLRGRMDVHTVSGEVILRACHLEGLVVDTVSGDVVGETCLAAEGLYSWRSVSGNLTLLLPQAQPCTVHMHTLSGEFSCDLPHEAKHHGWGRLEVAINGGGVEVRLRSTSGNIAIRAATHPDQAAPTQATAEPSARPTRPLETAGPAPRPQPTQEPFSLEEETSVATAEAPSLRARRMEILKAIEEGRMTVSEGLEKLRAL